MPIMDFLTGLHQRAKKLFRAEKAHEQNNNLDQAYEAYRQAADLDFVPAMTAIAALYLVKEFRQVEENNLVELLMQGMPIFPWSLVTRKVPDYKTAFEWLCKAADCGDDIAAISGRDALWPGPILRRNIYINKHPADMQGVYHLAKDLVSAYIQRQHRNSH